MTRLLIQFASDELSDFRWAQIDEDEHSADIAWQAAGEDQLPAIAAQHPHPLIMILPQQCVYLARVEMPERAGRQLLSAIEFQVEDQLASDIENLHFAIGDSNENPVPVAVVERDIMARCIALAQGHGLRLVRIVPELFLVPWTGSGVVMMAGYDGYLLRYGPYQGQKCSAQALPAILALVRREAAFDSVTCFTRDIEQAPEVDGFTLEQRSLSEVRAGLFSAPLIDLQQRDFQMSSAWRGLARAWKWVGLLLAALLVIGGYNKAMALQSMERELAAIKQQQYELLKPHLPADVGPNDNLKKALIDRLQQLQSNRAEQGFLALLLEFTRARAQHPEVALARIGYQGKQLIFDISSAQLNQIEALLETVKKNGVNASLASLNIKPELSSGRLILQGGDDG